MNEQEFDSLLPWRSFEHQDVKSAERLLAVALALWGRTTDDLRRQLQAPTPKIPEGCTLADLRQLQLQAEQTLGSYRARVGKFPTTFSQLHPNTIVPVGAGQFNTFEARCEIARRAVQHLRGRQSRDVWQTILPNSLLSIAKGNART